MVPNILKKINWLKSNPKILNGISRGIEREALRIDNNGKLSKKSHPIYFGSALTHKWITTDFSEMLLEIITPVNNNINQTLSFLKDIHIHVVNYLDNEKLWPMSMPCYINNIQSIKLARYGSSNLGRMRTLYRKGLKNRYCPLMQIISGIHYNFSFPNNFWKHYKKRKKKDIVSLGYLKLIRNYYRFGWIIPYLFGASPGFSSSFLQKKENILPFKNKKFNLVYLPYATSLRLSDLGYTNQLSNKVIITFNNLKKYISFIKNAINTPSNNYKKIEKKYHFLSQLNSNILQIDSELYTLIKPKRKSKKNKSQLDSLLKKGIEYIEVRSLDVNPFSPVGINEKQILFLDLFLTWCALANSPKISKRESLIIQSNWKKVILEGRKPNLLLRNYSTNTLELLSNIGNSLFENLTYLAEIFDYNNKNKKYQTICKKLSSKPNNPNLTLSAILLKKLIKHNFEDLGLMLSKKHFFNLQKSSLKIITKEIFNYEKLASLEKQDCLEKHDILNFEEFLKRHQNENF